MGLISFVKSAGRTVGLFGGEAAAQSEAAVEAARAAKAAAAAVAQAAEQEGARRLALTADIKAAILSYVHIDELAVSMIGDTVRLAGTAPAQADRERAVLVAGNTTGVATVDDALEVAIPEPPAVFHTVVAGDTLSKIAGEAYGVMRLYNVLFEANQPMLTHPDAIYPGQVLRIPPVAPPVHTVARGETLGLIAKHWLGDAKRYAEIFEANRSTLSSADAIEVGQELRIPVR